MHATYIHLYIQIDLYFPLIAKEKGGGGLKYMCIVHIFSTVMNGVTLLTILLFNYYINDNYMI